MGVGLRHGAYVWNIVPHYHVVECEISRGSKWQVAHHQAICKYTGPKYIGYFKCSFSVLPVVYFHITSVITECTPNTFDFIFHLSFYYLKSIFFFCHGAVVWQQG